MKTFLSYLSVLFVALLFIQWDVPDHRTSIKQNFGFEADSGYINKTEAIHILKEALKNDSIDPDWEYFDFAAWDEYSEKETLGKYYKKSSGNIYTCVSIPHTPAFMITEITPKGEIVKSEAFGGSINNCCMNSIDTIFRKKGDYFIIQTCGSGSAYCSSYIYIFKELVAQEEREGINEYVFNGLCDSDQNTICELSSTIDVKGDTIIMHYTATKGKQKKNGDIKIRKTEKFDVFYTLKGQEWIPSDTSKLKLYQ